MNHSSAIWQVEVKQPRRRNSALNLRRTKPMETVFTIIALTPISNSNILVKTVFHALWVDTPSFLAKEVKHRNSVASSNKAHYCDSWLDCNAECIQLIPKDATSVRATRSFSTPVSRRHVCVISDTVETNLLNSSSNSAKSASPCPDRPTVHCPRRTVDRTVTLSAGTRRRRDHA